MRIKKTVEMHKIELEYPNEMTRMVKVRAASREVAEARALKRNPKAVGVVRKTP